MNLIILAAGRGTRLATLSNGSPKSLMDLGDDTTLLGRQLSHAIAADSVTRVTIVVGYRSDLIEAYLEAFSDVLHVETIHNPHFASSNALMSLWCAHYMMGDEDFMVSNGDNIYGDGFLEAVVSRTGVGIWLAVSDKDRYDFDDMKVLRDDRGLLRRVSKEVPLDAAQADSVGLVLVRGVQARQAFRQNLLSMASEPKHLQSFWQETLNDLVASGHDVQLCTTPGADWREIDFPPDAETLRADVLKGIF